MYPANNMTPSFLSAALKCRTLGLKLGLRLGLRIGLVHALCIVWLAWSFSGLVQAQTILDYSRVQRAALEAEMAKGGLKASGAVASAPEALSQPPAWTPELRSARPSSIDSSDAPPPLVVNGAMILPSRALAEVQVAGVTHYLSQGDRVPGTPWSVSQISARQVALAQPRPGKRPGKHPHLTRSFQLPVDPQNIGPSRALKPGH